MNQQQQSSTGGQMGQQQGYMQQPPFVLTTKDHLYIEDMLSWNLNAVKKAHFFSQHVQDPEVKNAIVQMCQLHQRHYQTLLNHMSQHLQTGQQTAPAGGMQQ